MKQPIQKYTPSNAVSKLLTSGQGGKVNQHDLQEEIRKEIEASLQNKKSMNHHQQPEKIYESENTYEQKRGLVFEYETASSSGCDSDKNKRARRASLSMSLRKLQPKRVKQKGLCSDKRKLFNFVAFFIPTFFALWYAVAILFPPEARGKYDLLLWDDGQLIIGDDGTFSLCPRSSICAEGPMQIMALIMARLSAFASYVFMGASFLTKMHFLNRFLASTYLRKFIPFECLHLIHKKSSKMFGGLILMHTLSHYLRYIARKDMDQLTTKIHVSGLIGVTSLIVMIIVMCPIIRDRKIISFETRFNIHWIGIVCLGIALCIHHWRTRIITLIFILLWSLDYLYGLIFATYNLEVVEFLPLPKKKGVQMLWRNRNGFHPKSGEYVLIQLPWLSEGGDEWHPFSIYLKESTEKGFKSVHDLRTSICNGIMYGDQPFTDEEAASSCLSLKDFMQSVLEDEFQSKDSLNCSLREEAREDIHSQYDTTQVFISPIGDWSKNLMQELEDQQQKRACWVRGPYTSPYHVAQNFSHLVMTATGIGITPALGVMGQYPGLSRTKILIWSVRDRSMVKFFAPLIKDAHLAIIYYTGSEKLSKRDLMEIGSHGNIFIEQTRPKNGFSGTVGSVIVEFENHINLSMAESLWEIEMIRKAAWCILYCGGSQGIKHELKSFSKDNGIGFESELFNW